MAKGLEPLLPRWKPSKKGGRPLADNRAVFEGILWVLRTGARWRDLPEEYGVSPATCWRCLHRWEEDGVWEDVWQEYLRRLDDRNLLGWQECFIAARGDPLAPKDESIRIMDVFERTAFRMGAVGRDQANSALSAPW